MDRLPIRNPPNFNITTAFAEADAVLGQYLRLWSAIEFTELILLNKLMGTSITVSTILMDAGIDQRTLRKIISALGSVCLSEADAKVLEHLLERLKTATTVRNKLVDGQWRIDYVLDKTDKLQATSAKVVRFYSPADPKAHEKLNKEPPDQKLKAAHVFELSRILEMTDIVDMLVGDIDQFCKNTTVLPIPHPDFAF